MPLHYLAWSKALGEWNCEFSERCFYGWGGMPIRQIIERLAKEQGLDLPVAQIAHRKEALYYEHLPSLRAIPECWSRSKRITGAFPSRLFRQYIR
jgi:beta-phosphoglucomutase-like phosphatase (HAD superfamily)